jgi:hypothetical protein
MIYLSELTFLSRMLFKVLRFCLVFRGALFWPVLSDARQWIMFQIFGIGSTSFA